METNLQESTLEPVYRIEYEITSSLNYADLYRYCIQIQGTIKTVPDDEEAKEEIKIGRLYGFKVLVSLAQQEGYDIFDVFDLYREVIDIAQEVWDFKNGDY